MAYYRLSQVLKMRREAMEHSRFEYDVDGPSFMTVYRLEKGDVRVKEKTYRSLSRAMGEEESTRQGVLHTKDIRVLWLVNEISNAFLNKDYEKAEQFIMQLEEKLDGSVKRNQQYLEYVKAELQYHKGIITEVEYEAIIRNNISYGNMCMDEMIAKIWPFHEQEWEILLEIVEAVRRKKEYKQQKKILELMLDNLKRDYMETEFNVVYITYIRWRTSDVLGNMGYHREAVELDEETIRFCEDRGEHRYRAEVYYDIFWNYSMLKKKETLTEQEEARCKECLLRAYYINKAWYQPKKLYEKCMKECYPEELG